MPWTVCLINTSDCSSCSSSARSIFFNLSHHATMAYYFQRGYGRQPDFERHPSAISFRWEEIFREELEEEAVGTEPTGTKSAAFYAARVPDADFPRFYSYEHKDDISQDYRCLPLVEVSAAVRVQSTVAKTTLTQVYR